MNLFKAFREIYTITANRVLAEYQDCRILNAFVYAPPAFPCMCMVLSDDGTRQESRDSSKQDKFRDITVTVDVYSNKAEGKKTEAEDIIQIVIDTLYPLNFEMTSCKPMSNMNNASQYRLTATFVATIKSDNTIYTRR